MREALFESLLEYTRDGEWGKGEPGSDLVKMGVIRGTDFDKVRYGDFSTVPSRYIPKAIAERKVLRANDILIETAGGTVNQPTDRTVFLSEKGLEKYPDPRICASFSRFLRIGSDEVSAPYLFWYWQYLWRERLIYDYHIQHTGVARFQYTLFASEQIIPLPSLPEQREIAALLGALDDKIEVNRKASATLEAMARALYRSWIVDFDPVWAKLEGRPPAHMSPKTATLFPNSFDDDGLPLGWKIGNLSDVATNPRNGIKPEQIHPETPYIGLEHMPRRSITLADWGSAADVGSQKSEMRAGDFLFGKLRPYFHKVGVSPVDGICSTDIIVVRPKSPEWSGFVLTVISSDEFVEHTNAGSSGTRMPRTNWTDMGAYAVTLPPPVVAAAFEAITSPWRERIVSGIHEAKTLATLRNSLLPQLMSGELRVGAAHELIEEVA
ncbi:MAG: hypothetical protein ACK4HF_02490 [Paracoccaceae bacterium]